MKSYFILFLALMASCAAVKPGLEGQVMWISGNQMPGPAKKPTSGEGVEREVLIYEVLTTEDVMTSNGFITQVNKPLIQTVHTNKHGAFTVKLKPGTYSLLVKEPRGLFANRYDQYNHIQPITVQAGERTKVTLIIDYEAAY